jgi:DNA-binding winged helix-turn-helix (wHTH) protein/Tol biopolymer transport system component
MARYRFLEFELSEEDFTLSQRGHRVSVEPKALSVLMLLVSRGGHLVEKQELLSSVWPNTFVEENTLTRTIGILRRQLGDSSRDSRIIETVPTRGYRFIAPVEVLIQPSPLQLLMASAEEGTKTSPAPSVPVRPARLLLIALCAVAIVTAGAIFLTHRANGKHGAQTEHHVIEQRVTSNSPEAPVDSAVISPDGKFLAYSDPTGLYLRVVASGEIRRWDLPKDFIAKPNSWFPDGTHLLVIRWAGKPTTPSLWKLSLLGAAPQKLIDSAVSGSVSPDGTRIAFGSFLPSWGGELWVMGADGSNPHKIAQATQPVAPGYPSGILSSVWSPNSRRIACIERYGFAGLAPATDLSSLWTREAEGGDLRVIFKNNWLGPALSWLPDGRILFATRSKPASERDDEDMRSIHVDERNGKALGQPEVVTTGAGAIGGISVTSDGKRVVLTRTNSRDQAFISEFDANTRKWKTPQRLTLDSNGNQATAWLPDSRTVLFVSNRNGTWALYKQAIDENTADVLVGGHSLYLPRLSADGSQVLYGSQIDPANPSTPVSLMRLPVAGGPPQLVLRGVGLGNYQCARLPSTLCIVHKPQKNDCIFLSFDPQHGIGRELLRTHDGCHNWSLSPDGRTLADFLDGLHKIRFFSLDDRGAREDKTVTLNDWLFRFGDWSADGKGLLVPSFTPAGTPVMLEVSRAGQASVVLEGTANTAFDFMIQAPDGRHGILGAVVPGDNNAWMIDNL